jgi:hypothetical protein
MLQLNVNQVAFLALSFFVVLASAVGADGPWRLKSALDLPTWADVSLEQRLRYESLGNNFKTGRPGSDQALALRTSLLGQIKMEPVGVVAELMDSRQYLSDSGSAIDTTQVNAVDLLQGYGCWKLGHRCHDALQGLLPREGSECQSERRYPLRLGGMDVHLLKRRSSIARGQSPLCVSSEAVGPIGWPLHEQACLSDVRNDRCDGTPRQMGVPHLWT